MKSIPGRKRRRRKCPYCRKLFTPDPRQRERQRYCSASKCQKVRQARNWRRWFARPENRDYYGHKENVERVQHWRAANPQYWKRRKKGEVALPKPSTQQSVDNQSDSSDKRVSALPKPLLSQPALTVGLIAQLTGSTLPKDIAESSRRLLLLGQDLLGQGSALWPKGDRWADYKTSSMSSTTAAGAPPVQLDRSAAGARGPPCSL